MQTMSSTTQSLGHTLRNGGIFRTPRLRLRQRSAGAGGCCRNGTCRASLKDDLMEVNDRIRLRQAAMQQHVEAEDYQSAAKDRDSINLMQLRQQHLQQQYEQEARTIRYSVGTVMQHKRYHYLGVITTYTPTCQADQQWQRAMKIDQLEHGANQPFYHVLVDRTDQPFGPGDTRYVAQENIQPLPPQEARPLYNAQLEEHFSGFDDQAGRYVPKEEVSRRFPDVTPAQQQDVESSSDAAG